MNLNQIKNLAIKFGSPFFLLSEKKIEKNIETFRNCFEEYKGKFTLGYSTKTNPSIGILQIMKKNNIISECASYLDLASSIEAGYLGDEIVYAGLHKPIESLEYSIEKKIKIINIESLFEAKNIYEILKKKNMKIKVGIRIAFPAKSGIKSILGVTYDRFGASTQSGEAKRIADFLVDKKDFFDLHGLHCHPGSNIKSSKNYKIAIDELVKLSDYIKQKHNIKIKLFNIGGGVGITQVHFYSLFDLMFNTLSRIFKKRRQYDIKSFDQKKMLKEIVIYLNKKFKSKNEFPEIMMEPGRALIGNAIDLKAKVVNIKKTNSGKWLIIDAGTNLLPILTLFTEYRSITSLNENSRISKYSIAGPLLYSSDVIATNVKLPEQEIGDFINIGDVGAYFNSQSSHFLFARCATVLEDRDGNYKAIERKEEFADIITRSS